MTTHQASNDPFQILVVDDDQDILDMLEEQLQHAGYEVIRALSGQEALNILYQTNHPEQKPVDMVLLDIMMPGLDGVEVLERIRSDASLSDIPVLMLTALESVDDKVRAFEAGANDYLTKPFDCREVLVRMKALLRAQQAKRIQMQRSEELAALHAVLNATKDHLNRLVASSLDGIITIDTAGIVIGFNTTAERILGYKAAEVRGKPVSDLYSDPEDPRRFGKLLWEDPSGRLTDYETHMRSKTGKRIPISLSAIWLFDAEGNRIGSAGHFKDRRVIVETERHRQLLLEAINAVAQAANLDDGLHSLAQKMVEACLSTFCLILLRSDDGQHLVARAAYPVPRDKGLKWDPGIGKVSRPFDEKESAAILSSNKPISLRKGKKRESKILKHIEEITGLQDMLQSTLVLPLITGKERFGVCILGEMRAWERSPITKIEVEIAQSMAAQVSALIWKVRFHELTQQRMEELEHMHQAAETLAGAADLQEVLEQIVHSARKVLRADSTAIWSYDAVRDRFISEGSVAAGIPAELWEKSRREEPRRGRVAYTVMEQGWIGVIDVIDIQQYPFLGKSTRKLLGQIGAQSFQGIALTVGNEKLGVLYANYNYPRSFNEEERETAQTFANHAAIALKKAKLLAQVNKARNAARVVAEVTALGDLRSTLESIVMGTRDALGCDVVTLYTYDEERDEFGFPPAIVGVKYPEKVLEFGNAPKNSVIGNILALDNLYVSEHTVSDSLMAGPFAQREAIRSSVGIPLIARDRKVGVMFVNFLTQHRFTDDELTNISLYAYQAAVAIRNAQLYEQVQRRADALQALYEAGRVITSSLDLSKILNNIIEQAWRLVGGHGKQVQFSHLALVDGNRLKLTAVYPQKMWEQLKQVVGEIGLEGMERIGVTGRVVRTEQSNIVGDVTLDPDYIEYGTETRSELAVPIKVGEQVIGVISIQHPDFNAFDAEDQKALEVLAVHAATAIQNAQQYEELMRTKGLVGARTALAWMGMASNAWRHSIEGDAINIRNTVTLAKQYLKDVSLYDDLGYRLEEKLTRITSLATKILERPITPPLSSEEGVDSVDVNDLIRERISQLWEDESYQTVTYRLDLTSETLKVRVSPEWLRRAFDILVDNAVEYMHDFPVRNLIITSLLIENRVEISFKDTGKGIPQEVLSRLFKEHIETPRGKGLGMGLLMAQAIVQTYGGDIQVQKTGPDGTTMVIWLPVEQ